MGRNIYYDQWTSALLSVAILSLGLYVGPFIGGRAQVACWAVAAAAAVVYQVYDRRKISRLKLSRTAVLAEADDLLADL